MRDYSLVDLISTLIVDEVSATKMVFNQFADASIIMVSIRTLIILSQRRMLRIQHTPQEESSGLSEAF